MIIIALYALGLLLSLLVITYFRISRGISYRGGVPRVGPPGVLGYIKTALQYTFDAELVITKGRADFSGKAFVIPTLSGPVFFLPPKYLEIVRSSNDDVFNEPMAVSEDLQLPYTMDVHQMENPYQASVLRTDVNRAIPSFIAEILEESNLVMAETLDSSGESKSITLPVFNTMTHLIARISNRVIFGTKTCRDPAFLRAIVRFSETVTLIAPFVRWTPWIFRRLVYIALSSILGGKQKPLRFIVPLLKKRRADDKLGQEHDKPRIADFLLRAASPQEPLEGIAMRLMNINFGSIHTSSIFITQVLFELALLPRGDLNSIREEVMDALESEGGWTKTALLKFKKIDSALREVGRYYGLMHFALPRISVLGHDLLDGTSVPPGHRVAIDMKAVHFNPQVYPDPDRCDLFRFAKMREDEEGASSKYGFATPDSNYLPFGAGRHACAGRFFAAMELKIMLAHILLNYDISFPPGVTARPANITFNGAIIPDSKAQMVFTRRQ
ncbi:putative cytochrome p450 [Lyophyllum shimeji]|uniref:Cytochrome p450 n=1 Tax=Lyophyllum shimeji TaxID=47721 RepID=A0A9P3PJG7_LYOSH|nr:putative cytochrome p450 [Lyophyllum shimeji]